MNKDRKILYKFIALMVFSLTAGVVMGYFSASFEKDIAVVLAMLLDGLVIISPYLMPLALIPLAMAWNETTKGKKAVEKALAADDEALYDTADEILESALAKTQYSTIYSFMIFGVMTSGFGGLFLYSDFVPVIFAIAVFLLCLVATVAVQSLLIKQTKLLNPEKQGNILDTKFHRQWFDSCDEAERALIGSASYKSYQATSKALITAFVVLTFAGFVLPVGPVPVITVCYVWFVQYFTYLKAAKERRKK